MARKWSNLIIITYIYIFQGGNQRDLAREKNQKKQQQQKKSQSAAEKTGNAVRNAFKKPKTAFFRMFRLTNAWREMQVTNFPYIS